MHFVVTGGLGFVGSAFVRQALDKRWADKITVIDCETYAANRRNLEGYSVNFLKHDLSKPFKLKGSAEAVFHFAAETHVDNSIAGAAKFVQTNLLGTQNLLDAVRAARIPRLVYVSTDEVYGSLELGTPQTFTESWDYAPNSPYAASKAGAELLVKAAVKTHGLDAVITRCGNNYGPGQHPEKLIPKLIQCALHNEPMKLYGDGRNVRDWIHVDDHAKGVFQAYHHGKTGEAYNIGNQDEQSNRAIAELICDHVGASYKLIQYTADRPGHDRRYALNTTKAQAYLGLEPSLGIYTQIRSLIEWHILNPDWWSRGV